MLNGALNKSFVGLFSATSEEKKDFCFCRFAQYVVFSLSKMKQDVLFLRCKRFKNVKI